MSRNCEHSWSINSESIIMLSLQMYVVSAGVCATYMYTETDNRNISGLSFGTFGNTTSNVITLPDVKILYITNMARLHLEAASPGKHSFMWGSCDLVYTLSTLFLIYGLIKLSYKRHVWEQRLCGYVYYTRGPGATSLTWVILANISPMNTCNVTFLYCH
jgi:hypothetical protein